MWLNKKDLIFHGWRDTTDNSVTLYQQHKYEVSVESGYILQDVVLIPGQQVIDELHEGHPGISRMKSLD